MDRVSAHGLIGHPEKWRKNRKTTDFARYVADVNWNFNLIPDTRNQRKYISISISSELYLPFLLNYEERNRVLNARQSTKNN